MNSSPTQEQSSTQGRQINRRENIRREMFPRADSQDGKQREEEKGGRTRRELETRRGAIKNGRDGDTRVDHSTTR